jgi:hypothetical protein
VYSAMCFFVPADFVSHRTLKDQIGTMILSFKYGAWFFAEQLANFAGWSSVVLLATVITMTVAFWFLFCRHALSNVVLVTVLISSPTDLDRLKEDLHQSDARPVQECQVFVKVACQSSGMQL